MHDDFDPNDRNAIMAALASKDPDHPVAVAINARLTALAGALQDAAKAGHGRPDQIEVMKPATVLDAIAVDLFKRTLASVPGAPPVVVSDTMKQ